ncbi:hypothetical protein P7C70_g8507, partial [Phenoliferia sp. Uapishka_3]
MDNLLSFGKQAYSAYEASQNQGGNQENNNQNQGETQGGHQQQSGNQGGYEQQGGNQGGYQNQGGNQQHSNPYEGRSQGDYQQQGGNQGGYESNQGGSMNIQGGSQYNSSDNNRPSQGLNLDQDTAVQHAAQQSGGSSDLFAKASKFKCRTTLTSMDELIFLPHFFCSLQCRWCSSTVGSQTTKSTSRVYKMLTLKLTRKETPLLSGLSQLISDVKLSLTATFPSREQCERHGRSWSDASILTQASRPALKMFTSGGGDSSGSTGGSFQSKLIGQAMSEAASLFDQSGGAASGNKQDAVTSAGQTMMKLLLKNQVSGMMGGGGGSSGGLSSMLSMASKFM